MLINNAQAHIKEQQQTEEGDTVVVFQNGEQPSSPVQVPEI